MNTDEVVIDEEVSDEAQIYETVEIDQKPIRFSVTDAAIAEMKDQFSGLKIEGPNDKEGFDKVHEARIIVMRSRTGIEKKRKALVADALAYQREVNGEAKRLTDALEEIEKPLLQQEKEYQAEVERIAEEKAAALRLRYQKRVEQLQQGFFTYNARLDAYEFGEVIINVDDIRNLNDDEYEPTADLITATQQAERDRLEQVRLQEEAERQRIENEQKAEAKRLAEERRLLAEQQAELQERVQKILQIQLDNRKTKLADLGMVFVKGNAYYGDMNFFPLKDIASLLDEEFDKILVSTSERIAVIKADQLAKEITDKLAAEQKERDQQLFDSRVAELLRVGFIEDSGFYINDYGKIRPEYILKYTDEQFTSLISETVALNKQKEAERQAQIKVEKEAEQAKLKADKERTARLKPEKKLLTQYLKNVRLAGKSIELTQPETKELQNDFISEVGTVILAYLDKVDAL